MLNILNNIQYICSKIYFDFFFPLNKIIIIIQIENFSFLILEIGNCKFRPMKNIKMRVAKLTIK